MDKLKQVLEAVKPGTTLIPIAGQYVAPALEILIKVLEMAEKAKSNKEDLALLEEQATRFYLTIIDKLKDVPPDDYDKKYKPLLDRLFKSIDETKAYFERRQTSAQSKSIFKKAWRYLKSVWRASEDKGDLDKLKHVMNVEITHFLAIANLDELLKLDEIGGRLTIITSWTEEFVMQKKLDPVEKALHTARDAPEACEEGTSTLLLGELEAWATSRDARRIYWLSGQAGTGKTTVARTLCDRLARLAKPAASNSLLIISFFVSRRHEADRGDPLRIVHTLSYYLARALPNFRAELLSRLEVHPDLPTRNISEQWDELIAKPLELCASDQRTVVIVIDAFDESRADDERQRQERCDFLRLLLGIVRDSALHIRLLFTSRSIAFIDDAFQDYRPLRVSQSRTADCVPILYEHKIELPSLHDDVKLFLNRKLKDIAKDIAKEDWPTPDNLDDLATRANGLFIYAATVFRYIRDADDPEDALATVMNQASLPSESSVYDELDKMYGVVLTTAASPTVPEKVQRILAALAVSQQPLTVAALAGLLGPKPTKREVEKIIGRLASVLRIESERISFYHGTFLDYLTATSRCTDASFRVDPTNAHRTLATRCLAIMNSSLEKNDLIGLGDPSTLVAEVADLGSRISDAVSVPLIYACMYWRDHLKQSLLATPDESQSDAAVYVPLEVFCKIRLLRWIEARSLLGNLKGSDMLITSAADCCQAWSKTNNGPLAQNLARISGILRDAGRLLSTFYDHIAARPLQVYVCAALFLPDGALLDAVDGSIEDEFKPAQLVARAETWSSHFLDRGLDNYGTRADSIRQLLAVSPDGSRIITVQYSWGSETELHIRSALSGVSLMVLEIENDPVALTFSSGGHYAVILDSVGMVSVWDLARSTSVAYDCGLPDPALSMAFSPGDRFLSILSSSCLTRIPVISNSGGMRLGVLNKPIPLDDPLSVEDIEIQVARGVFWPSVLGCHAVGAECTAVASTTTVKIYRNASCIATFPLDSAVTALEFAPPSDLHGLRLAVGTLDGRVVVWSQKDERVIHTCYDSRFPGAVRSLAFFLRDDTEMLASASGGFLEQYVKIWSLGTGGRIWTRWHGGKTVSVVFLPGIPMPHLLFYTNYGSLQGWNVSASEPTESLREFRNIKFSIDNRFLAIADTEEVRVQEMHTGGVQSLFKYGPTYEYALRLGNINWAICNPHGPVLHLSDEDVHWMRDPMGKWVSHQGLSGCHETATNHPLERARHVVWNQVDRFLRYRTANGDWHFLCPLPPDMDPDPGFGGQSSLHLSDDGQFLVIVHMGADVSILKLNDKLAKELRRSVEAELSS